MYFKGWSYCEDRTQVNEMNKTLLILMMLIALPAVAAYTYLPGMDGFENTNGALYVTAVDVDPSPAVPGDYIDVWVKVENRGSQEVPDAYVSVLDEAPFSAIGEDTQRIGKLGPNQAGVAHFQVKVDAGAPSGSNSLRFGLQRYVADTLEVAEVQIQLKRLDAVLAIDAVTTTPEVVAPGDVVRIGVLVTNKADTSVRAIRASLRLLTQATTTAGISTSELPFTPIGGGIERTIDSLAPGMSEEMVFTLIANPDAENKPYKIPITIVYYDPTGSNRTREEIVGVVVGGEPELSVYLDSTEITSDQGTGTVIVRFVNRGVSDVKFLTARLNPTEEYVIVSAPESYIGKIDSDDYETAEFKIALTNKADGTVELPIVMEYRDGNNKKYSAGTSLALVRYTAKELGTSSGGFGVFIFVLLVLGVVGWFAWKKKWFRR